MQLGIVKKLGKWNVARGYLDNSLVFNHIKLVIIYPKCYSKNNCPNKVKPQMDELQKDLLDVLIKHGFSINEKIADQD